MSDDPVAKQMIEIGLADPFIKGVVGMVAVATAVSFVLSILGDGTKAALALGLALMFGVILTVLRVLVTNLDSRFVQVLCFAASGVITCIFLLLIVIALPAITICQPAAYSRLLGTRNCVVIALERPPFNPVPYDGIEIVPNPANKQHVVLVFFRPERQGDAERIVGALHSALFNADAQESSLNEVISADRDRGTTLIKATSASRPLAVEIERISKLAIPIRSPSVVLFPRDAIFTRGDVQIDLF